MHSPGPKVTSSRCRSQSTCCLDDVEPSAGLVASAPNHKASAPNHNAAYDFHQQCSNRERQELVASRNATVMLHLLRF